MVKSILPALAGIASQLAPALAAEEYYYAPPIAIGGNTWQGINLNCFFHNMVINTDSIRELFLCQKDDNRQHD